MNKKLEDAAKWLNELGIETRLFPNCLKVCLAGILVLEMGEDILLGEIRSAVDSKKIFIANRDNEWLYLESF